MAAHKVLVDSKDVYYQFWLGHRKAIFVPHDENYKQWDTLILYNESPKWHKLEMYFGISFIESNIWTGTDLLHLKK